MDYDVRFFYWDEKMQLDNFTRTTKIFCFRTGVYNILLDIKLEIQCRISIYINLKVSLRRGYVLKHKRPYLFVF